ncbi:hypothetical protein PHYPSEUDO_001601 [Phytophthora pseudosyringae]|uniref:Uncharacterized protein n=1 Tax=Phytophthora pseudosyringae TaxID=221518 RepID=A0A8T1V5P2_9STRA|nr:hypothetical protein PHYPSEUDO_001601 [Phytophthora pseudosyringae]
MPRPATPWHPASGSDSEHKSKARVDLKRPQLTSALGSINTYVNSCNGRPLWSAETEERIDTHAIRPQIPFLATTADLSARSAGDARYKVPEDMRVTFQRWRLDLFRKGRRGFRASLTATLVVTALFVVGLRVALVSQTKFLRAPVILPELSKAQLPPPTSVLHPNTPLQPALNTETVFSIKRAGGPFPEYLESFPQHGQTEPGLHYRIENTRLLAQAGSREQDSLLLITVFNDAQSWGTNRSVTDYFELVSSLDFPKEKMSLALLTSSKDEFLRVRKTLSHKIHHYSRLSVIFRNDFSQEGLTRLNRHSDELQLNRRRMLARYRNYALLSNLQTWHQHVLWLDADIVTIPADLLLKMSRSGLDIVTPMCSRRYNYDNKDSYDYDLNAWVGHRKVRPANTENFVPGPLSARNMHDLVGEKQAAVPLDSVGGTMLYVRADVHRQGVVFPAHYIIGSEWGREGYDGIETEGFCYNAHFLGYKCWGMPKEIVYHAV